MYRSAGSSTAADDSMQECTSAGAPRGCNTDWAELLFVDELRVEPFVASRLYEEHEVGAAVAVAAADSEQSSGGWAGR